MDLQKAKALLKEKELTCVLYKDETVYESSRRGVAPLMEHWEKGTDLRGFSAADKVVGKATALLYCLLGVKAVYANVISDPALDVLLRAGIQVQYALLVDAIQNRTGDGFCPMETATRDINDPVLAPAAIQKALDALRR